MNSGGQQPWTKRDDGPLTIGAMQEMLDELDARAAARSEERAMEREHRMKIFLALVPILWAGIALLCQLAYALLYHHD